MNTEVQHQENISFSHNELCTVMKNNLDCDFTDVLKQAQALKEYMLKKLSLDEEEIFECLGEFEEKIKTFVLNTCSNYKKSNRMHQRLIQALAKDGKKESKQFELPNSITIILQEHRSRTCETKQNAPILQKLRTEQNEMKETNCQSTGASQTHEGLEPTSPEGFSDPCPIQRMPAVMKPFSEKSKRSQQYASAAVRESHEPEAITLAASQQPTPLGLLIKRTNTVRGISVEKALNAVNNQLKPAETFQRKTPEEALGHILNNHLTKDQYLSMKTASALSSANIWPNYNKILKAKAQCRPDGIVINELNASVPIQNLLDHTTRRILLTDAAVVEKMKELADKNNGNLEIQLYFKYGFDGCGSFNTNMQKDTTGKVPDASTLVTSQLVPLQAVVLGDEKLIIHNNPRPNNANACRPIRLSHEKECQDNIRTEASHLQFD